MTRLLLVARDLASGGSLDLCEWVALVAIAGLCVATGAVLVRPGRRP